MVENCMSGYNSCMFAYGQVSIPQFTDKKRLELRIEISFVVMYSHGNMGELLRLAIALETRTQRFDLGRIGANFG